MIYLYIDMFFAFVVLGVISPFFSVHKITLKISLLLTAKLLYYMTVVSSHRELKNEHTCQSIPVEPIVPNIAIMKSLKILLTLTPKLNWNAVGPTYHWELNTKTYMHLLLPQNPLQASISNITPKISITLTPNLD